MGPSPVYFMNKVVENSTASLWQGSHWPPFCG